MDCMMTQRLVGEGLDVGFGVVDLYSARVEFVGCQHETSIVRKGNANGPASQSPRVQRLVCVGRFRICLVSWVSASGSNPLASAACSRRGALCGCCRCGALCEASEDNRQMEAGERGALDFRA